MPDALDDIVDWITYPTSPKPIIAVVMCSSNTANFAALNRAMDEIRTREPEAAWDILDVNVLETEKVKRTKKKR